MKDILGKQQSLFLSSLSLIPSENYSFYEDFKSVLNSDIMNRYSFYNNSTFSKAFPGHKYIQNIEEKTVDLLKDLFCVKNINISPLSGMNALSIFLSGIANIGDTIFLIHPNNGGHFSTEKIAKRMGYRVYYVPFKDNFYIDYQKLDKMIEQYNPKLIYVDQMNGIMPVSMKEVGSNSVIKYYDISHNAAFIASKDHVNPLNDGYNAFGGSTHKTIPGPQKAFFATNDDNIHIKIMEESLSFVSNNHISNIAMLGITLERMSGYWKRYTNSIITLNNYFASKLQKIGATIILPLNVKSQNHQLFWYFQNKDNTSLYEHLTTIGIYVNLLPLPFQNDSILGFRTGVQELCFLGGKKNDIDILIDIIKQVLSGNFNIKDLQEKIPPLKQKLLNNFTNFYD